MEVSFQLKALIDTLFCSFSVPWTAEAVHGISLLLNYESVFNMCTVLFSKQVSD